MVTAETGDGGAARAVAIVGQASVIDGDTIEVHGARIRLHGIDAPESDQLCVISEEEVRCGQQAAIALYERIGRATVSCRSEERHVGKESVSTCRSRWSQYHEKKNKKSYKQTSHKDQVERRRV